MITRIKLSNWKSHVESELRFGKGSTVLVGTMGSGKSSIIDAICFAFFGTFPALKSRRITLDEVVTTIEESNKAIVEMEFNNENGKYSITRIINRGGGTESFLRKEGKLLEGPQSVRVTETVVESIGMDYELFSRAVYSEQNRIDYFLSLPKGDRKRQVDELLGIDKFDKARASCSSILNRLKIMRADHLKMMELEGVEGVQEALKEAREMTENAEVEKRKLEEELDKCYEELERLRRRLNEMRRKKVEVENLSKQLSALGAVKKEIMRVLASLPETKLGVREAEERLGEARKKMEEARKIGERLNSLKTSLNELSGRRELIEREITRVGRVDESEVFHERELLKKGKGEILDRASAAKNACKEAIQFEATARRKYEEEVRRAIKEEKAGEEVRRLEEEGTLEEVRRELSSALSKKENLMNRLVISKTIQEETLAEIEALEASEAVCKVCGAPLSEERRRELLREKKQLLERNILELRIVGEEEARLIERIEKNRQRELALIEATELLNAIEKTDLNKADEELRKATLALNSASEEAEKAEKEFTELLEKEREIEEEFRKAGEGKRLKGEREKAEREAERILQEVSQVEGNGEDLKQVESMLEDYERVLESCKTRERNEEIGKEIALVEKRMHELEFSEESLVRDEVGVMEKEKNSSFLKANLQNLDSMVKERKERLEEVERRMEGIRKMEERSELMAKKMQYFSFLSSAIVETQTEMRSELIGAINEAMGSLWKSIYPYRDYSNCRISASEVDYELELYSDSLKEWVAVERCSGGERSCTALALRVAFSMIISPKLSLLVMDEPTHNLDEQAVQLFSNAVHEEVPKIVEQVFVVTHEEALKEAGSSRIYKIERDKDNGGRSIVEEL